jgi:hypothetical protein
MLLGNKLWLFDFGYYFNDYNAVNRLTMKISLHCAPAMYAGPYTCQAWRFYGKLGVSFYSFGYIDVNVIYCHQTN